MDFFGFGVLKLDFEIGKILWCKEVFLLFYVFFVCFCLLEKEFVVFYGMEEFVVFELFFG